jgi:hypothetical protein
VTARTFDERVVLLEAFAACVDALPSAAWQRLRLRCAPLLGRTPDAVFARALLAAVPYEYEYGQNSPRAPLIIRAIAGTSEAVIVSTNLAFQLLTTFVAPLESPPRLRHQSTGTPQSDRVIDAFNRLEHIMHRAHVRDTGVATAVRAAAQMLLRDDSLSPSAFERGWRWIANEVPFERISAQPSLG